MKQTAIIIVNWNGWKDTKECLESFDMPLTDAHFFIVDNASTDDSLSHLEAYFMTKAISYCICTDRTLAVACDLSQKITLIANRHNQGFAGANNLVLKFLLPRQDFSRAWMLNNDTIVTGDSLRELHKAMDTYERTAFCGSVILDYNQPELIQCCGVNHYAYLGISKLYLKNKKWNSVKNVIALEQARQHYQNGASLLVDLSSLREIGLMDEMFFLYSEEADWQLRAAKFRFENRLAWKSIIYHKGSMSTAGKKHLFFFNYNRSAILLTRKNFSRLAALTATLSLCIITAVRARLNIKSLAAGIRGIVTGWRTRIVKP